MLRGLSQTGFRLGGWKDRLLKEPERLRVGYVAVAQGWPRGVPGGRVTNAPVQAPSGTM